MGQKKSTILIGSDEVGWGAVAGPLYVVGVAMPRTWWLPGLRDSKQLSVAAREGLFDDLIAAVRGNWELSIYQPWQIDSLGAQHCLVQAHTSVILRLLERHPSAEVIVDGNLRLPSVPQAVAVPGADDAFQAVAAASVVAKVIRDSLMRALAFTYPQYGFETNAGYKTKEHTKALKKHGLCPIHRRSYLKSFLATAATASHTA